MKRTANTTTIVHHCNLLVVGCLLFVVSPAGAMRLGPGWGEGKNLHYLDEHTPKRYVLASLQDGNDLQYVSDELKKDKEVVLVAVQQNGRALRFASDGLQTDKEVVLAAVRKSGIGKLIGLKRLGLECIKYMKNDRDVVLAAVQKTFGAEGNDLQWVSEELKNDKEVVLAAVRNFCSDDGLALRFASKRLKEDKEVVLAAVRAHWRSLEFASDGNMTFGGLRGDKEVVLAAVEANGEALQYASDGLKDDKEVVLAAVQKAGCWRALQYASKRLKNEKEVVLAAVQKVGLALQYASKRLKNTKEVVLAAVQNNWRALEFASDGNMIFGGLNGDKDVVLAAVRQNRRALEYASDGLKNDKDVEASSITSLHRGLHVGGGPTLQSTPGPQQTVLIPSNTVERVVTSHSGAGQHRDGARPHEGTQHAGRRRDDLAQQHDRGEVPRLLLRREQPSVQ